MGKPTPGPITTGRITDLIFLEWVVPVDGYRIEKRPANQRMEAPAGAYLIPTGTSSFVYQPMHDYPAMFREFADVELSPEGVVSFANKYGSPAGEFHRNYEGFPMTAAPLITFGEIYRGNELDSIYGHIQGMRTAVERHERGDIDDMIGSGWSIARARLKFDHIPGRDAPNYFIQPESLNDAMWFQFARYKSAGMNIKKCAQCPTWFPFGTGTGRRKSAMYCSDRCRKAAYEKRRRPRK